MISTETLETALLLIEDEIRRNPLCNSIHDLIDAREEIKEELQLTQHLNLPAAKRLESLAV